MSALKKVIDDPLKVEYDAQVEAFNAAHDRLKEAAQEFLRSTESMYTPSSKRPEQVEDWGNAAGVYADEDDKKYIRETILGVLAMMDTAR